MGTQFSKIKVTQRVELHGEVFDYADGDYDTAELPELFTRRAHHSGVISGHELLSYSFLGGAACEPRRSLRRKHRTRSKSAYSSFRSHSSTLNSSRYILCGNSERELHNHSHTQTTNGGFGANELHLSCVACKQLNRDGSSPESTSELDSGISVNVNYEDPTRWNKRGESNRGSTSPDEEKDDVLEENDLSISLSLPQLEAPIIKREVLPSLTQGLKRHYREHFSDWFEPGSQISRGSQGNMRRRSSRKKKLHQKLVLSQMNTKKATKLDMDDRAKIIQYFSKANNYGLGNGENALESVRIEDMFGTCWSVPMALPALPTVITVQAPAGIGKSSMLKYMCMKWGGNELWGSNFDVLIFVECRTLNRLGSMTGTQFMDKILEPIKGKIELDEMAEDEGNSEDNSLFYQLTKKAGAGRLLLLLDGLDEVHGVGNLAQIRMPAGHPEKLGQPGKGAAEAILSPLEFAQCLLTGSLLQGCHVIVTSRPHTLSHLQSSRWFLSLPKRMVSLDIQGLSEEGVQSFIHSYVDARTNADISLTASGEIEERHCAEECPCQPLQIRARADPYIFSLATNPFYLWLICTIFSEAGEDFIPKTLTQLYTWVMLVFANRWQNTSLQMTTSLTSSTVDFLLGFARLCYHLVKSGNIKMTAHLNVSGGDNDVNNTLSFPDLGGVCIDQDRAEAFGLMTVSDITSDSDLECEFRHLSLAEYLTALHVHVTGDSLKGFARDRKELILQYLCGLSSTGMDKDQMVVKEFLQGLGSSSEARDPVEYLKNIQRMKGEWFNQQGLQKQMLFMRCVFESRLDKLDLYPFPGLKVINIRGSSLLALDLIIIGNFVAKLDEKNRLLEMALRDYPLDRTGLLGLIPCIPLIRTLTLNARKLRDPDCYDRIREALRDNPRSRLRELWLLDVPDAFRGSENGKGAGPDPLGRALNDLKEYCRLESVKVNITDGPYSAIYN